MDINFKDLMELARKAALYDGIISFAKTRSFIAKEDILAFAGEIEPAENASEDGEENV